MPGRRCHKIPEWRWLEFYPLIYRLWVEENQTYERVAAKLKEAGFWAEGPSKRQFEYQIDKWKLQKYKRSIADSHSQPESSSQQPTARSFVSELPQEDQPSQRDKFAGIAKQFALIKRVCKKWQAHRVYQWVKAAALPAPNTSLAHLDHISLPGQPIYFRLGSTLKIEATNLHNVEIQVLVEGIPGKLDLGSDDFYEFLAIDEDCKEAYAAQRACQYGRAEQLFWSLIQKWRSGLCPTDRRIFEFYRQIAISWLNRGAIDKARTYATQLFEVSCNLLWPEDYLSLTILQTMAAVNERSGPSSLTLAEDQYRQLMRTSESLYGENFALAIGAMAGVASVLRLQNRLGESEEMYAKVVALRAGTTDDEIYHCQEIRQYADVLSDLGRVEPGISTSQEGPYSIPMYQEAERRAIAALGPSHQVTLRIQSNLAADLRIKGQYEQSAKDLLSVYLKQRSLLGGDHPDTSWTLYQYAKALMGQGKYQEALLSMKEVYEHRRHELGDFHMRTLNCCVWLGWLSEKTNKLDLALQCYEIALRRLNELDQLERIEESLSYGRTYRVRWLRKSIARVRLITDFSLWADVALRQTVQHDADEELEIHNSDDSPVQCIIEEESDAPETCGVLF